MTDTDGLRQQIAEVLRFHRWKSSGDFFACACGHVPESSLHMEDHRASSLLPIVTAWTEQQAQQRAAEELRAVADAWESDRANPAGLRAYADALTAGDPS
jgi:hypothetical protein